MISILDTAPKICPTASPSKRTIVLSGMLLINGIFGTVSVICTILIVVGILIDIINRRRNASSLETQKGQRGYYKLLFFTNTALFVFLVHTSSVSLIRLDVHPETDTFCLWLTRIHSAIYHLSRCLLYAVLVCRVEVSFRDSTYQYHAWILNAMYSIICVYLLFATFCDLTYVEGYYDTNLQSCIPFWVLWGALLSSSVDFVLSILSLILFIRPLVRLNRARRVSLQIAQGITLQDVRSDSSAPRLSVKSNEKTLSNSMEKSMTGSDEVPTTPQTKAGRVSRSPVPEISVSKSANTKRSKREYKDHSLGTLILRYALLVIIAIGSTFLFHAALMFAPHHFSDVLAPVDNTINVWCIILINTVNKKLYRKMCYVCHAGMKKCCG